ncbi:hypothetical protein BgAZ_306310 [Babesia gibsoni]|uniref:aspartate carbamoyltransferase n=1 Tax=Babesia gibsoni TaxID=33632 RepID=A0AAD8LKF3_BABGI|nr:hypothetical protein BgAZ_306310 [Babesia gibsoni]
MSHTSAILLSSLGVGALGVALFYAAKKNPSLRRHLVRLGIYSMNPVSDALDHQLKRVARGMDSISVLSVDDLTTQQIMCMMELAAFFKKRLSQKMSCQILQDKTLVTLFHEPSTRTRCSFEGAMLRLGGKVISVSDPGTSSAAKGESIEDSARVLSAYGDVMVLRHSERGVMQRVKKHIDIPLINAGDGAGEHPTQALLDLYTISTYFPILQKDRDGPSFVICFVGDLKHGRTAHSLAKLLSRFDVVMRYVAPSQLQMPTEIQREVEQNFAKYSISDLPIPRQTSFSQLEDGCEGCDVIYVTRLQKERMDEKEYQAVHNSYKVTKALLATLPRHVRIMHPLPRLDEIPTEVDSDERAIYFEQAQNGLYVRMAMLYLILNNLK